ncbi:regulatory protein LuxR [Pseudofrankia inefficax]|uniref:Regulatory protein LuxR n=2 Tax=Pseudofrankia inefficax (strain DSM 45817 / CECT 9037 / DDB 130130 / EuI1c) TaxID=298654 RepID=E3J9S9_PSEI1|nr:regulatory protein LuxR [Pseudofrankia inefficax]
MTGPSMAMSALTGRERELAVLDEVLDGTSSRGGALVLVGEAGIGKSALLGELERRARARRCRVLTTVGVEAEAQLPFAGLHQLLQPVLRSLDGVPAAERDALLSAFGMSDGPRPEGFLIARAVLSLVTSLADGARVALIADDVQWLDPQTHEVLAFLARRSAQAGLVVVGAARTGHPGPFLAVGLRELVVTGLDDASAEHILGRHAGDLPMPDRRRILRESAGNPLALLELPESWRLSGGAPFEGAPLSLSARLERAFGGRITDLPAQTRDAVLVAAVDGENTVSEILAATAVLSQGPVSAEVLDPAVGAGLLRVSGRCVEFRHPLVRSGVLQSEPLGRRQSANAALARVLVDEPYRQTWHRAQSVVGPDDDIADGLDAAAAVSLKRGAVMSAIATLERAAQLTTGPARRGHRLLVAAEHAFGLGRADLVSRLIKAAVRNDLDELDWARTQWLREIFHDGIPGDATRVFELCDVARRSAQAGDVSLALNLLLGAGMRCWWADTGPAARARVTEVLATLPGQSGDPRFIAALAVAEPVLQGAEVTRLLDRVVIDIVDDPASLRLLGMAAHAIGDSPRAAELLDRAETLLRDQGRLGLLAHVLSMQVVVRLELGSWDRAAAAAAEGRRLAEDTGQPIWTTGTLVCDARAQALRGDAERALDLAGQAELAANQQRLNDLLSCVQLARGIAWFTEGRYEAAYDAYRALFDPDSASYHQRERFDAVMFLAEAAVLVGRREDALAVLADLERVAAVTPSPLLHVQLRYARAVLARPADAEAQFRAALDDDLSQWPWVRARIELAYGTWLRRAGRCEDARGWLRHSHQVLGGLGAITWAQLARVELAHC